MGKGKNSTITTLCAALESTRFPCFSKLAVLPDLEGGP